MKLYGTWVIVFFVLMALAYGVDHGEVKLGVPVFVWLALNLTVFLFLLARFVGQPVSAFLEARKESISGDLKQAQERLAQAEQLKTEVLARLSKVELEVSEIHTRAETLGREESDRIAEEGRRDAERLLRRVADEISQRETETRESLAKETAELTAQMARQLLQEVMTDADRKKVMERSVEALLSTDKEG